MTCVELLDLQGNPEAVPVLLDGLERLEYRGYDSAGIGGYSDTNICLLCCSESGL